MRKMTDEERARSQGARRRPSAGRRPARPRHPRASAPPQARPVLLGLALRRGVRADSRRGGGARAPGAARAAAGRAAAARPVLAGPRAAARPAARAARRLRGLGPARRRHAPALHRGRPAGLRRLGPAHARPRISAYADDVAAALGRCGLEGSHARRPLARRRRRRRGGRAHRRSSAALALLAPVGFGPIRLAEALRAARRASTSRSWRCRSRSSARSRSPPPTRRSSPTAGCRRADLMDAPAPPRVPVAAPASAPRREAIAAAGRSPHGFARRELGFDGPVAALWGERDALVPLAHLEALRRALPQAHVEVWAGMGHHPQRERPRRARGLHRAPRRPHAAPARPAHVGRPGRRRRPGRGLSRDGRAHARRRCRLGRRHRRGPVDRRRRARTRSRSRPRVRAGDRPRPARARPARASRWRGCAPTRAAR